MTTRTRRENLRKLTATGNVERATPPDVFAWLDDQFRFTVDVASTHANALCEKHYTREDNGLAQSWHGERAFMNPPFGKSIGEWVAKARSTVISHENSLVACVLPARVDAEWWQQNVMGLGIGGACEGAAVSSRGVLCMRFAVHRVHLWHFGERVKFDGLKTGAPFPTSVVVFSSLAADRVVGRMWRPRPTPSSLARPCLTEVWL